MFKTLFFPYISVVLQFENFLKTYSINVEINFLIVFQLLKTKNYVKNYIIFFILVTISSIFNLSLSSVSKSFFTLLTE